MADVAEITRSERSNASLWLSNWLTPSATYSWLWLPERFWNGSTASDRMAVEGGGGGGGQIRSRTGPQFQMPIVSAMTAVTAISPRPRDRRRNGAGLATET